jgi:hypothetical protein
VLHDEKPRQAENLDFQDLEIVPEATGTIKQIRAAVTRLDSTGLPSPQAWISMSGLDLPFFMTKSRVGMLLAAGTAVRRIAFPGRKLRAFPQGL